MVKINLFFNWYEDYNRQKEIDKCLSNNINVFNRVIIIEGRPTFSEMFAKAIPDEINCFCNSDIYFTDLTLLQSIQPNDCYAITRDDLRQTQHASGSQDAWCFVGSIRPIQADFTQGLWGCDNRLAYEINKAGYDILNPPITLMHLHAVDKRDQRRHSGNTVPPPYLLVPPIVLEKDDKGRMYIKGTDISDRI